MKQTNIFPNLFAAIKTELEKNTAEFISGLRQYETVESILNHWQYNQYMTATKKAQKWELPALIEYIISRKIKADNKKLERELSKLEAVSAAPDFTGEISVSVEWVKSRMWGYNPKVELSIWGGEFARYYGSASGCGYDKESAAIADALNQCQSIKKALYLVKEQAVNIQNRDIFGYGSGYGILPYFEGGVGADCYRSIFERIGFKWAKVGSGKSYDAYKVTALTPSAV